MIQQLLLAGQALLILMLYLFVWLVIRTVSRDLAVGGVSPNATGDSIDDSTIIPAADAAKLRRKAGIREPRIVVQTSSLLREGIPFVLERTLSVGRESSNDIVLDEDVVSTRHARFVSPDLLVDNDSTNGTLLNDRLLKGERSRLKSGDLVQIGSTVFRFEEAR